MNTTVQAPPAFSLSQELNSAWQEVSGKKATYWGAIGYVALVQIVMSLVYFAIFGDPETAGAGGQLVSILMGLVGTTLSVGVFMVAIEFARGKSPVAISIFDTFNNLISIALCSILMTLLIIVGLVLLILPGIYLAVSYIFALPLVHDKKLGVWDALETSRKAITAHWFSYFFALLLMSVILMISALPFLIGLIWTVPMSYNLYGRLYRQAFDQ